MTSSPPTAGLIERWRVIHGGVRATVNLQFRKLRRKATGLQGLRAAANDAFVANNCTGEALPQHLVAADGPGAGGARPWCAGNVSAYLTEQLVKADQINMPP